MRTRTRAQPLAIATAALMLGGLATLPQQASAAAVENGIYRGTKLVACIDYRGLLVPGNFRKVPNVIGQPSRGYRVLCDGKTQRIYYPNWHFDKDVLMAREIKRGRSWAIAINDPPSIKTPAKVVGRVTRGFVPAPRNWDCGAQGGRLSSPTIYPTCVYNVYRGSKLVGTVRAVKLVECARADVPGPAPGPCVNTLPGGIPLGLYRWALLRPNGSQVVWQDGGTMVGRSPPECGGCDLASAGLALGLL